MTVWRTGWGPVNVLLGRREEGLTKMMGFSCLFHFFLFVFLILNNAFFAPRTPSFYGFQVNLVTPGFGLPGSASGKGSGLGTIRNRSKKGGIKPVKVSMTNATSTRHAPKPRPSKKSVQARPKEPGPASLPSRKAPKTPARSGISPSPQIPETKTLVQTKGSAPRPGKERVRLGKVVPPVHKDPERLEDWWTKQKRSLKMPATVPEVKADKRLVKQTRTRKIDIKRRAIVAPPASRPVLENPGSQKETLGIQKETSETQKNTLRESTSQNNAPSQSDTAEVNHSAMEASSEASEPGPMETASSQASVGSGVRGGGIGSGVGMNHGGGLGPGIKGVGTGTGSGGGAFFFPTYLQTIDSKIRWQWAPPPIRSHEDSLVVRFVINKDGSIDKGSITVKESSGNIFFDQAGLRAVFAAHPLPPLPKAYAQNNLIIYINFIVREDT